MSKQKRISLEERKEIQRLTRLYSASQIAKIIGRSKTGVLHELNRFAKGKYDAQEAQEIADKSETARIDKIRCSPKLINEEKLKELINEGHALHEIAQILQVGKTTVRKYIIDLNLDTPRKISSSLEDRIIALEMVFDILTDKLKEIEDERKYS